MNDRKKNAALAELVQVVTNRVHLSRRDRKICLLLGAGADISSGGMTFWAFKSLAIQEYFKLKTFDVTTSELIDARFEELVGAMDTEDRARLAEWIFHRMEECEPSDSYKLLVLLTEAGGIDAVVTTNFDNMLERAQNQLGRDLFQVFAPGVARPYAFGPSRRESVRKPYLKLHGDIEARVVTLLTAAELATPGYDEQTVGLLREILETHDLVIAGYGGYDTGLAQILADGVTAGNGRVYWCNPSKPKTDSPLFKLLAKQARIIEASFDEIIEEIARPSLERPSLAPAEPMYVRRLLDWRLAYCNHHYFEAHGFKGRKDISETFARRPRIEERLVAFMKPNRPLALVVGASGMGKSTLGIRMARLWEQNQSTRIMLVRAGSLHGNGDIEEHIREQLGGLGAKSGFSLFQFERWLRDSGTRLVLFIDGINEFSPDMSTCIRFFRGILRICHFLPEQDSALRLIATIRQETWNTMLDFIDHVQIRNAVWSEDGQEPYSVIACGKLTGPELDDALRRLQDSGHATIDSTRLSAKDAEQLRDPFLLGLVAEVGKMDGPPIQGAALYRMAFGNRIRQSGSLLGVATIEDSLASLALLMLETGRDSIRTIDVHPVSIRSEVIRVAKDLDVLRKDGQDELAFTHDRAFEYFLAVAIASTGRPPLETMDDLLAYLRRFKVQGKPVAAARLYFNLDQSARFPLIFDALKLLDSRGRHSNVDCEILSTFAREVLVEAAEQGSTLAQQYLADVVAGFPDNGVGERRLRGAVQAIAQMSTVEAVPLLARAAQSGEALANVEAHIYALDKLAQHLLATGCPTVDILEEDPYAAFFGDPALVRWKAMGRLLGLAARIGPDNTHPDEYSSVRIVLSNALSRIMSRTESGGDASEFFSYFLSNCDRLMFNTTPDRIKSFFENPVRATFSEVFERLATGQSMSVADFDALEHYSRTLDHDIEYHLLHVLIILASMNDLPGMLALLERRYAAFDTNVPPVEVDFFDAALVYIHIVHCIPYDENRFRKWEEKVLDEWPQVLLYQPGKERGEGRGFPDPFDQIFEDGFSAFYPYGVLLPSARRRSMRYPEYREITSTELNSPLELYVARLEGFVQDGRVDEAIQVLKVIAHIIVVWPREGMTALRGVIGAGHNGNLRRATVRVLAEAYGRHPEETMKFLKASGAAVSDDDLMEIKVRHDARMGRRQIGEEEFARIAHFLLGLPSARDVLVRCIRVLFHATDLESAVHAVFHELMLVRSTGQ
jgi:hypothetical protein